MAFAVFLECMGYCGQDIKGTWGMPSQQAAMKDVEICDKPRGADNRRDYSGISEWGNLAGSECLSPLPECIGQREQYAGN